MPDENVINIHYEDTESSSVGTLIIKGIVDNDIDDTNEPEYNIADHLDVEDATFLKEYFLSGKLVFEIISRDGDVLAYLSPISMSYDGEDIRCLYYTERNAFLNKSFYLDIENLRLIHFRTITRGAKANRNGGID